jgi:hypothetical protein
MELQTTPEHLPRPESRMPSTETLGRFPRTRGEALTMESDDSRTRQSRACTSK